MIDMYAENILEHYKHPHNHGTLEKRSIDYRENNPLCGDVITIYLLIENEKVKDIRFVGQGCAISQAATSLLTDEIKGKSIEEIKKLDKDFVLDLLGVEISPARMKCALLGIKTLKLAIYDYLLKQDKKANEKDFEVEDA
ncbi:MAG: SUF system NifU family Fe-S cluster assembly protein [Candidatus Aenigmarchaeota archaeon]|nr:SUF system NifU family Fe-S cluster assembly protein [Candidatus Aenigmarchaeota archaeon]